MSARDMSRRGTVGGGRARFQPRARGANRSFRGRGSAFLSVSSCFSSRKPAFDWELLPLLLRFVGVRRGNFAGGWLRRGADPQSCAAFSDPSPPPDQRFPHIYAKGEL